MRPTQEPESGSPSGEALQRLLEGQHAAALTALDQQPLDAVAWVAAHVAAVERVLYRAVRRTGRDGRQLVRDQCAIDRELLRIVWQLDRRLTGDVINAAAPTDGLSDVVRRLLAEHAAGEQRLLPALGASLDEGSLRRLHDDLHRAIVHAPTRPHPLVPSIGAASAIGFRLEALVDRVRDALDARHVPVPRQRPRRRAPGRWGLYALGATEPYPQQALLEEPAEASTAPRR